MRLGQVAVRSQGATLQGRSGKVQSLNSSADSSGQGKPGPLLLHPSLMAVSHPGLASGPQVLCHCGGPWGLALRGLGIADCFG